MSWDTGNGEALGTHNSVGVNLPARTWYMPEGCSAYGFECWTLVENPGAQDANITLTYMIEGAGAKPVKHRVPAHSRSTYNMEDDIGQKSASIEVTSDVPVIPERSMYTYWKSPGTGESVRREGHESIGTTNPATDYYLAEGTTAWGFRTYVLIQNPNKTTAKVTLTYNTAKGEVSDKAFTMPAESRKTVYVNEAHPNVDLSTHVHSNVPIIAERAMYWSAERGTGNAMHDSIGVPAAHTTFEGQDDIR
ncbi:MAG TPA: DUF5719 family protein [Candidatus Anoxymicrobiaceae bacterium]